MRDNLPSDISGTVSQVYTETLKKIATNQLLTPEELDSLSSKKAISQAQLFTVVQARNSLIRIYKLTEFLDKFADKFMDQANQWQENYQGTGLPMKTYESIFNTIMNLLNQSHSVVSRLLDDNRLSSVIIDNSINVYSQDPKQVNINNSTLSILDSTASRDRVRAVLSKVIIDVSKVDGVPKSDYVEGVISKTEESSEDWEDLSNVDITTGEVITPNE